MTAFINLATSKKKAFIIASLNKGQTKEAALLEKYGFKRITEFEINPNSGNDIAVWIKSLAVAEAKQAEVLGPPKPEEVPPINTATPPSEAA
jgi:hypothetical protein